MKNMNCPKLVALMGLILAVQVNSAIAGERSFNCLLNKSNSLVITLDAGEGRVTTAELRTEDFLGRDRQRVAVLSYPQMQLIEYGGVIMLSQDFGRSGYIFVRLEKKSATEYDAYVDVNYFQNRSFYTEGKLVTLSCVSYGS